MKQLGSHWTDFHENWYFSIFQNSFEKIQISLKSNKNNGYFKRRAMYLFITSRSTLLTISNVSGKSIEKTKHTRYFQQLLFRKSCRLWDNVKEYCTAEHATDDNIIWCTRTAWWIPEATNTYRTCNMYWFSTAIMVAQTRLHVTLYVPCLSCFNFNVNDKLFTQKCQIVTVHYKC
jgi:hypothetical protein